jgi:aspartate aminotransferase
MAEPELSDYLKKRKPSAIRVAEIEYAKRADNTAAIKLHTGNVSLPMHPAMIERLGNLRQEGSPFENGAVRYTETVGFEETNRAFMNIIESSGFCTDGLSSMITDGASHAMELTVLGVCGKMGELERPLLTIDATYPLYRAMTNRTGRKMVSVTRQLQADGKFSLPPMEEIEQAIRQANPGAMLVIPYDNPTGHFYDLETMASLGELCSRYNLWMVSDEAYRELFYVPGTASSIWGLTNKDVPGIEGRRISLETASKVWNACGLRIGAIITDNQETHSKLVAENTANLCAPAIDQYIFGSLAHVSHPELREWYAKQREYYNILLSEFTSTMRKALPGTVVSSPDASIYSVVDVKNIAKPGFDALDFVVWCAREGKVSLDGEELTLLFAPMKSFYNIRDDSKNPGMTQMRFAFVESPEIMGKVPALFAELFKQYETRR